MAVKKCEENLDFERLLENRFHEWGKELKGIFRAQLFKPDDEEPVSDEAKPPGTDNLSGLDDSVDRLIRLDEVLKRIPVARSTWFAGVKSGRFPPPVRNLGPRIAAWRLSIITRIAKGEGWQ